jgi:hypothetical protein
MHIRSHRLALLVLLGSPSFVCADPGFGGIRKKSINVDVRKPAAVRLTDTSIAFTGNVSNTEYASVLESLRTTMETEVISNERTLIKKNDPKEAEWTLFMSVTGYGVSQTVDTAGKVTGFRGTLNVSYQVLDRTGRVHDADNLSQAYPPVDNSGVKRTLGGFFSTSGSANSVEDAKQALVHSMAQLIGSNLGNSTVPMGVQLAGGEDHIDRAGVFMTQKLWTRAAAEMDDTKPFPKPEDESYRLYTLGLAYEGMSYEAKAAKDQRANMFRASELYDKAAEINRKQDYFVATIARIRDSITRYKILDEQQQARTQTISSRSATVPVPTPVAVAAPAPAPPPAVAKAPAPVAVQAPVAPVAPVPAVKANTVADIIKMHVQQVPEASILEIIRAAPLDFNPVDVPTVLAMAEAKLPATIQNEMRKKVGAAPLPAAAPKPAARKPTAAATKGK